MPYISPSGQSIYAILWTLRIIPATKAQFGSVGKFCMTDAESDVFTYMEGCSALCVTLICDWHVLISSYTGKWSLVEHCVKG